jgi:hypothetical protein
MAITIDTFSDVANNRSVYKFIPQGMLMQRSTVTVPIGVIGTTIYAMIHYKSGWVLSDVAIESDALNPGGNNIIDVFSINDLGDTDKIYLQGSDIAVDGGLTTWKTDPQREGFAASSIAALEPGYLIIGLSGQATTQEGNITAVATFSYDV